MAHEPNEPATTGQKLNRALEQAKVAIDQILQHAKPLGEKLGRQALVTLDEASNAIASANKAKLSWVAIVLAGVMLLSVNVISGHVFRSASVDMTASGLYSISSNTKKVLTTIDEPIDVRIYFSEQLGEAAPLYKRYFDRVRALFEQYANMSGGKLRVSFIEPEPFSDAEDRAVAAGLRGVQLNAAGDQGFFGLVATNSTDQEETVQFFSPERERYLEYDMTKLVHTLAAPKKLVIGLMSGLPVMGGMSQPRFPGQQPQQMPKWAIVDQIEEFFDVKTVDMMAKDIPDDVDVLMIVQPAGMSEETAYAVDQFALSGKAVLAFIDPVPDVGRALNPSAGGALDPQMDKLLKSWGVKFDTGKVAGDLRIARRVQMGGPRPVVTEFVTWLAVNNELIEDSDVISDGVKEVNFSSAGFLQKADKATTQIQPLLQTTPAAMEIPSSKLLGFQPDPVALLREYKPGTKQLVLAARVTGEIKTSFSAGKPKPASAASEDKPKDKEADKSTTVTKQLKSGKLNAVIVTDSDILYDDFWVQAREIFGQRILMPTAHNATFVVNALENLSGGEALSGLRGRGVDVRLFTTVDDIRREAELRFRQKENELAKKLEDLRTKLAKVEQRTTEGTIALSEEDKKAIEEFRSEMVATRKQLRDVKHAMRADIDSLEGWLKFINIAGVPLLFGLGGIAFATVRRRRHAAARS